MDELNQKIRRSTRDIKRPKFDDEIVESAPVVKYPSLKKSRADSITPDFIVDEPKPASVKRKTHKPDKNTTFETSERKMIVQNPEPEDKLAGPSDRKRKEKIQAASKANAYAAQVKAKPSSSAMEVDSTSQATISEILKLWTVQDDILLMASVHHLCDLNIVHSSTPFSKIYTLAEIDQRWFGMLYDEAINRATMDRIEKLTPTQISAIQAKIPFSAEEEEVLTSLGAFYISTPHGLFENLLSQYPAVFHHCRTAASLEEHWRFMKHYNLLSEQNCPLFDEELSRMERQYEVTKTSNDPLNLNNGDERSIANDLYHCLVDVDEWERVAVSAVTGVSNALQFDHNTLAVLKGRCVSFDIRKDRALIGRSTQKHRVDVNLTFEGPTAHISRRQAVLKITCTGRTVLYNIGQCRIFIDKHPVDNGEHRELQNNSMLEIGLLRLLFCRNEDALYYRQTDMEQDDDEEYIMEHDEYEHLHPPLQLVPHHPSS